MFIGLPTRSQIQHQTDQYEVQSLLRSVFRRLNPSFSRQVNQIMQGILHSSQRYIPEPQMGSRRIRE